MATLQAVGKLVLSVIVMGGACYGLVESCYTLGSKLNIPIYIVAVVIAAAATSIPDTFISVRTALKGEYEDSLANALGSNIFDITVCIGLPLVVYYMQSNPIVLQPDDNLSKLRITLLICTFLISLVMLIGKRVNATKILCLIGIYGAFITHVYYSVTGSL